MADVDTIRTRDHRIRLFRMLVCLLAAWCVIFPLILMWSWDFDFLWRLVTLGPNKVDEVNVSAFTIEFLPSEETARVLFGCLLELIIWIAVLALSFLKSRFWCYFAAAIGIIVGFFSVPFYFLNTNFPHPFPFVKHSFDATDLHFYIVKSSTIFWLGFSPKIFILSLLIVTAYKLARPTKKRVPSSPLDWGFSSVLALAVIGAPLTVVVVLLAYGAMVSGYDNYYPPRVAKLAERAAEAQAKREKQRLEAPRLRAEVAEVECGHTDGLVYEIKLGFQAGNSLVAEGSFKSWKELCAGYYADPESWKVAKSTGQVRAIKMSREQLCADKNIIEYTLNPPPQAELDKTTGSMSKAELEAYQFAREAVRAWYVNAWNETCLH